MSRRSLMALAGALGAAAGANAQLSPWYTTEGNGGPGNTHVIQGGGQQFQYQWATDGQIPIYVGATTARQAYYIGNGGRGDEYLLNGTPTNVQNYWNNNGTQSYDAAFDGTNVYTVDWISGQVRSWDANYANGTALFQANGGDIGITFDGTYLWTSNWNQDLLSKWTLSGSLAASYQTGFGGASALAYDSIDGTLWMASNQGYTALQFDPSTNQVLQTYHMPASVLGGEMPFAVPAPGAAALAGLGGIVAMRRRR